MKRISATGRMLIAAALSMPAASCAEQVQSEPPAAEARTRELRPVPGCEGCEAAWERDPAALPARIGLAPEGEPGEPMILRGTVYKADGRTPAPGVVLYLHQTNAAGLYAGGGAESEWSRRHGRLRGWLKTGSDGRYEVLTVKPGQYPNRPDAAHVHMTVLEQGKDPYWIDDVVFEGEPGVDAAYRRARENRGGSGIVRLTRDGSGRWVAERDIVLED